MACAGGRSSESPAPRRLDPVDDEERIVLVMDDEAVLRMVDRRALVEVIREALVMSAAGHRQSPPRSVVDLGVHRLVFTAGGSAEAIGFRAYGRPGMQEEIVGVWDRSSGELQTIVIGRVLGPLRTGSIGAVAVDALARRDARRLTLIGSGKQARAQLQAIAQVRDLDHVSVTSPTPDHREAFSAWARAALDLDVRATSDVRGAVEASDIVICATSAAAPVLETSWVTPGTHVSTLGQRMAAASEIPADLADRATHVVTDAPAQLAAVGDGHLLRHRPVWEQIVDLGAIARGGLQGRGRDDITLFLSVGLAGTEVALAQWLASRQRYSQGSS
jgi:alanine dehydrogenase